MQGQTRDTMKCKACFAHPSFVCRGKKRVVCQCSPKKTKTQPRGGAAFCSFPQRRTPRPKTPRLNAISLSSSGVVKVLQNWSGSSSRSPGPLRPRAPLCRQLWFAFTANIAVISQVNPPTDSSCWFLLILSQRFEANLIMYYENLPSSLRDFFFHPRRFCSSSSSFFFPFSLLPTKKKKQREDRKARVKLHFDSVLPGLWKLHAWSWFSSEKLPTSRQEEWKKRKGRKRRTNLQGKLFLQLKGKI